MMDLTTLVNLFVNNGIAIAVIVYFCFRDYKFMSSLQSTLTTLVDTVNTLKEVTKRAKKEDDD